MIVALGSFGPSAFAGENPDEPGIPIGVDKAFTKSTSINFDTTGRQCTDSTCDSQLEPEPRATSEIALFGTETGDITREAWVGQQYRLETACAGQPTTLGFEAEFSYDYSIQTTVEDDSAATASINLRGQTLNEEPAVRHAVTGGNSESATDNVASFTIQPPPDQDNSTVYNSTLGAHTDVLDEDPETSGDTKAKAKGTLHAVNLSFGDDTPPNSTVEDVSSNATPDGEWYNEPVTVTVNATDPDLLDDGTTIAESCVDRIDIDDEGDVIAQPTLNFAQDAEEIVLDENRHYDLDLVAVDNNGNRESDATEKRIGFDDLLPNTDIEVSPSAGSGNNSWYNGSDDPNFVLTCDDQNGIETGEFSGCSQIVWGDDTDLGNTIPGDQGTVDTDPGEDVSIFAHSKDNARNTDDTQESPLVDFDPFSPDPDPIRDPTSATHGNDWFNESDTPVSLSFECTDSISGCEPLVVTNCDGTGVSNDTDYNFSEEGRNCKRAHADDKAGNSETASKRADIDLTDPPGIPDLAQTTETAINNNVNTSPTWDWTGVTDEISGIIHYNYRVSDGDGTLFEEADTGKTSFTAKTEDFPDDRTCFTTWGEDKAANQGPRIGHENNSDGTEGDCVVVDTIPPNHWFGEPDNATLYGPGDTKQKIVPMAEEPADMSYAVGNLTVWLNATDPDPPSGGEKSGLHDANITVRCPQEDLESTGACGDSDHVNKDCQNPGAPHVCRWTDEFDDFTNGHRDRPIHGNNTDRALNRSTDSTRHYQLVQVAAVTNIVEQNDGTTDVRGEIMWNAYEGDDFAGYRVVRATSADFLCADGTVVEEIDGRYNLDATDTDVSQGDTMVYKVCVDTTLATNAHASHETKLKYEEGENGEDRVSVPLACVDGISCI